MSTIFDAYDMPVDRLPDFYRRLNQPITYPDGMTTSLGVVYWGRDAHLAEIESAVPHLVENGLHHFNQVLQAIKTPGRAKRLSAQAGIPAQILRILRHDLELWLPTAFALDQLEWSKSPPGCLEALPPLGLDDQLAVISAGQTPAQRLELSRQAQLDPGTVGEIVKLCDYYRTGKNLQHIRAKIYYAMGLDTWQKWAGQTSESIIAMFARYIQENHLEERLVPWPKEVRNGIEWAKMHLEIFSVQW